MNILKKMAIVCFMFWNTSLACTCIGDSTTVENALKYSSFVFTGKVIASEEVSLLPKKWLNNPSWQYKEIFYRKMKYTFEVSAIYKGELITDTLIVYSGFGSGDCGYQFLIDHDYIVYANWNNSLKDTDLETPLKFVETDICTRTTLLDDNEVQEIEELITR